MRTDDQRAAALGQVLELALLVNDDMNRSLGRDGLTPSRAHLLWELHGRGPSTQSVLAEALGVSPRNVTGLVDGLVATGFVTREPHPTDRRATLVSFTDRGARTAAGVRERASTSSRRCCSTACRTGASTAWCRGWPTCSTGSVPRSPRRRHGR